MKKVEQKVQKVEKRLDVKILKDRANTLQERIWKLEDRYEKKKMPKTVQEELRKLKAELIEIQKDLEKWVCIQKGEYQNKKTSSSWLKTGRYY